MKRKKITSKPAFSFIVLQGSVKVREKKYTDSRVDRIIGEHVARDYGQERD